MGQVALPFLKSYRDRHGRMRHYFRRKGAKDVPLPGQPGSPEFVTAYTAALNSGRAPVGATRNERGTVAQAVSLYLGSVVFARLAPDTRRTRKNELERFREEHGDKEIGMERRHIERHVRDKSPVSARNCLKALSPFFVWCVGENLLAADPTVGIERPAGSSEGYKPWTDETISAYRAQHQIGSKARLALELLVNTGAARVDVVLIGRQHVRGGMLSFRRHKTNVLVEIPVLDDLQALLVQMGATDRLTFLLNEQGKPYSKEGFGNQFREWCNQAGIPNGYSAHGVRKYAATLRANLGATAHELMAWFGWLTMREAERYTRSAERRRLAFGLGQRVNAEVSTLRLSVSTQPLSD